MTTTEKPKLTEQRVREILREYPDADLSAFDTTGIDVEALVAEEAEGSFRKIGEKMADAWIERAKLVPWVDVTSYRRGDDLKTRVPSTWSTPVGDDFEIIVTRQIHGEPDRWYLRTRGLVQIGNGFAIELESRDIDVAKIEALRIVRAKLVAMIDRLP